MTTIQLAQSLQRLCESHPEARALPIGYSDGETGTFLEIESFEITAVHTFGEDGNTIVQEMAVNLDIVPIEFAAKEEK